MDDTDDLRITIQDDGPVLIILFLLVCLISIAWQISENARQRRKLAVVAGPNQETRSNRRMFFYTVLIIGLLTLIANYIMGVTSSLAAAHINEVQDPTSLLSLPGTAATLITTALYALAIVVTAGLMQKKERLGFPELLADLNDARKYGGLENTRQIAHYQGELEQLQAVHREEQDRAFTGGEFERHFTSHESADRPRLIEQLKYLRTEPHHRARTRSFHRNVFLNYRMTTGKWILPFALLTAACLVLAIWETVAASNGDFSLATAWVVACLLGFTATGSQYFCDVGKALLESRREYVSAQTEMECRKILDEAAQNLAATSASKPVEGVGASPGSDSTWEPFLRIGRWEAGRRKRRQAG